MVIGRIALSGSKGANKTGRSGDNITAVTETHDNTVAEPEEYDITGIWYSDRPNGDTLTLNKDGTYTSSNWLKDGKYTRLKNAIMLTDLFEHETQLVLVETEHTYTLKYTGTYTGTGAHTYYRTEQEIIAEKEAAAAADEEMQSLYRASLMQILTTGEWKDINGTMAQFTKDSITFKKSNGTVVDYIYDIVSFEVQDGRYNIVMDCYDTTHTKEHKNVHLGLRIGEDNTYTLTSGGANIVDEFAYLYEKTVEIDFTQPSDDSVVEQDIVTADRTNAWQQLEKDGDTYEEVIEREDGTVVRIKHTRIDKPDNSEQNEAAYQKRETAIYGTWKGSFEEHEGSDTVYWHFTFNKDGTYSFNDDSGYTETGTFVLGRNPDAPAYKSNMTLTPDNGEAYTLNFTMTGSPIDRLQIDSRHAETFYPTFEYGS